MGNDFRAERQLTLEKDEQLQAAKEKLKTITTKAVKAFQQTVKHPSGVDLENLDMEVIDQEMVIDEVSQSTAPTEDALGDSPLPSPDGDDTATN